MATQSKIRPFRTLASPLSQQNRRILGNPFPLTHPCTCSLREKTSRFYDHLGFALELSFSSSHRHLCRGCKISVAPPNNLLLVYRVAQPSDAFNLTRQSKASPHLSFGLSTRPHLQKCNTYLKLLFCKKKNKHKNNDDGNKSMSPSSVLTYDRSVFEKNSVVSIRVNDI